jgi:hypothetical protein
MISEKQKRLCMRFTNGALVEAEPPEWFVAHLNNSEMDADWQGSLLKAGATSMESFDGSETYEVYSSPNGYFVDYCDVFASAAWIFIDRPVDYITFRATMLAPLVMLSIESDRVEKARLQKLLPSKAGVR